MFNNKSVSIPVTGIFIIMVIHLMVVGASFMMPVTAAILGYFVLSRPRRALARLNVPNSLIALAFTSLIFVLLGAALVWFTEPVGSMIEDLPELIADLQVQLSSTGDGPIKAVSDAAEAIDDLVKTDDVDSPVEVQVVDEAESARQIISLAPQVIGQSLFAVLLLFFLIQSGDFFLHRAADTLSSPDAKSRIQEVVQVIELRLGRYLGGITLINAGLGVAVGLAMYLWGFDRYMALGLMAFALNFIPYLGGVIGASVAALIATTFAPTVWTTIGIFATYITLTSIEGQIITPYLISRRMRLNAPILFLVVAFFAYIWSVIGMIVAVPILIVAKIVCDEIAPLRNFGHFLGDADDDAEPDPEIAPLSEADAAV